jgi:hypothetical protein
MFSNDQMTKISFFATITKITNECFKKCVNLDQVDVKLENKEYKKASLSFTETNCLKSCSISYVKLREFVEVQLFEDYESIKNKNRKILEDET